MHIPSIGAHGYRFGFFPKFFFLIAWLVVLGLAPRAVSAVMYGATGGSSENGGRLYVINPANGTVIQEIGSLNDTNGVNYPLTGLAFHPFTGVLYGATGNNPSETAARLVRINPVTAVVTVIGVFNVNSGTMTDLAFHPVTGTLYGISSAGGARLCSINLSTGQGTVIGSTGISPTGGGGLTVSSNGVVFATPTTSRFGTFNPANGQFTDIGTPNFPLAGPCSSLAFNDDGILYGVNLDQGVARLLIFSPITGQVTDLGAALDALDAIAFLPAPRLTISRTGNQMTLRWPSSPLFQLEYRTNLTSGTWLTNTTQATVLNDTNTLSLATQIPAQFFRLRKP